jgi:hypothetical protein
MTRSLLARLTLMAAAVGLAAGCAADDERTLTQPGVVPLMARYVAMGNSITAGYQSGGINDSTQLQAYPVLLAARAGARFNVPLLNKPGCPAPYLAPLGATGRLGGASATACALRRFNLDPVQNVAVPGANVGSLTNNLYAPNVLTSLVLGGRTQVRAMQDAKPTFVSAWIGNNDALGAATSGVLGPVAAGADSLLTPLARFQARLDSAVAGIKASTTQGAILVGVVDAVAAAPLLQPGAYFYLARDPATGRFNGKLVNNNCSPITALGQPNPLAANLVSFQVVGDAAFPEINCDPAAYPVGDPRRGVYLLDTAEQVIVRARVAQFNAAIKAASDANSWAYVDPNAVLAASLAAGPPYNQVRKCQLLPTATTAAQFQTAVLTSCPVSGATGAPNFFGSLFTFDGVHPSAAAHVIITNALAAAINARYGTSLPTT